MSLLTSGNEARRFIAIFVVFVAGLFTLGLGATTIYLIIADSGNQWVGSALSSCIALVPLIAILKSIIPTDSTVEGKTSVDLLSSQTGGTTVVDIPTLKATPVLVEKSDE